MRIGLVSYEYPPQQGLGGVGTYMFRLAEALGRAGHEVHVLAGPSDRPSLAQANVRLHRIPAHYELNWTNRALRWVYWQGFARLLGWMHPAIWHWIKWDLASYDALTQLHAQAPLDIIEVPEHAANGWMAGEIHAWPIMMRMHCPWELFVRVNRFPFNPMNRVLSALERHTVAAYADGLTVPSLAMKHQVERSWTLRRRPTVIPNFMDVPAAPAALPPDESAPVIACVGHIEPLKGQDTLAQAFARIARKHPQARLRLIGPDRWPGKVSFAQLLVGLVPDPDIRARIDLCGAVPLEHVGPLLADARVAVMASRGFESFSFAALESLAMARPIIATRAGALPELIHDRQTGLLVPPANATCLADALQEMLEDRNLARECGLAGHEEARRLYHTPRVLPRILQAYQDAGDFYCHVKAARSERSAMQWRRAIEAARQSPDVLPAASPVRLSNQPTDGAAPRRSNVA